MPAKKAAAKAKKGKVVAKKTASKAKKPAKAAKKSKVTSPVATAFSKTQILTHIAEEHELSRKQVAGVFESLQDLVERHIKKRAIGQFTLPGLLKIHVVKKPATPARKGINPFTGEETMFKAKPARMVVKIKALKKLKEMADK